MSNLDSRYFTTADPKLSTVVFPLPWSWWSRPYEYAWCSQFVNKTDIVLDAACGISHPFKFWLLDHTKEVHVCDCDKRILSNSEIKKDITNDFGPAWNIHANTIERLNRECSLLENLPYETDKFDVVYCISVLEHLPVPTNVLAIKELSRVLKPKGKLVLTFDVPDINPDSIDALLSDANLQRLGKLKIDRPDNAITSDIWGRPLYCFRTLAVKK